MKTQRSYTESVFVRYGGASTCENLGLWNTVGASAFRLEAQMLSRIKVAILLPLWPMYDLPVLEAYVARKHKRAVGIEWCEFAPDSVRELLRAVVTRPHARIHRHTAATSLTISRLSAPLLKHGG